MAKNKRRAGSDTAAAAAADGGSSQHQQNENGAAAAPQPSTSGRPYTVSMAVSSSSIDNTQNIEFATFVAGQVGGVLRGVLFEGEGGG